MAVDLKAEIKNRKIAESLTNGEDDSDTESDSSTDEPEATDSTEETDSSKEPTAPPQPAASPSRQEAGLVSLGDYSAQPAASSTPTPSAADRIGPFTHAIAEDQPVADYVPSPAAAQPSTQSMRIPWGGTPINIPSEPLPIQTDPETGGRYVIDPDTGKMVPHAELVSAEDKAAQPTGGRELQGIEVTGKDYYAPEEGLPMPPEVRRARLVKLPPSQPSPETGLPVPSDEVRRAQLVGAPPPKAQLVPPTSAQAVQEEGLPVTPTPPKVEQGGLVSVPPGTAPKAIPVTTAPTTQPAPVVAPTQASARQAAGFISLGDYSSPKPAVSQQPTTQQPTATVPITGALAQGPPGTHPAGTEDEPYWPKSADQIGQLPAGSRYVDPQDGSVKTAPGQPTGATQQRTVPGQVPAEEPAITNQAREGSYISYQGGQRPIKNIIIHSSDGSEKGDINTLTGGDRNNNVSVHYYTTKDGRSLHFVNDNDIAYHAGKNINPSQYSNAVTIGIEQEHIDGQPWEDAEVRGTARTVANLLSRHPELTIDNVLGHSDIAPERKQDPLNFPWDQFRKYVQEDLSGAPSTVAGAEKAAPSAQPVTKGKNGFYQDEKPSDFLTGPATTFATPDDIASGQDNGRGAPKLGGVDTTRVAGIAVPQSALEQMFGRDWAAAARKARVDVVDPTTGKRFRVPIVDLGPRGDLSAITDQTPALANLFGGGNRNLSVKIIPNAGPDVTKNPQLFYDEQAAIKNGFDSSTLDPKRQVIAPGGSRFATVAQTSEEATAAQKTVQAAVQKQQDTLNSLQAKSTNRQDWYQTLSNPIPGVTDTVRNAVRDEYKKQITAYAQDYYKEPDPNKAFDRIMSAPNLLTSAGEIWTKAGANFQHAWLSVAQQADSPTQTKLIDFINAVQPNAAPEARTALINTVMSKTGRDRVDFVNHLYNDAQAHNPDLVKNVNMYSLLDAIDVSAQPGMQAKEAANHARVAAAVAQNIKDLREDPTMENTYGGVISNAIAQMPKNVLEAITPVIGQSAMFSEIYTDTMAGLRKDHQDWSEDQIKAKAAVASMPQDMLQELVNLATLGMGSGVTRGFTNPLARIATNAILHGTIASGAGTAQQAIANVATGRPPAEGLPQAAATGFIQGAIGGAVAGRHPAEIEGERAAVVEPPVQPPRAEAPQRPVTQAEVTGPEVSETHPWYKTPPIVTRGEERATFTPAELAEQAGTLKGRTPEELQAAAEKMTPPMDFGQRSVWLNSDEAQQAEVDRARIAQAPQDPATQAARAAQPNVYAVDSQGNEHVATITKSPNGDYHVSGQGEPAKAFSTKEEAQAAARDAFKRNGETISFDPAAVPGSGGVTGGAGVPEPWVSAIANKFVKDRMASGEIGLVEPGTGRTTEQLLSMGTKMGPEEVNQHKSDIMHGVGDPVKQTAAVRAEEARLSHRSHQASLVSEADPTNQQKRIEADNALKDLTDLYNGPMKRLKENWHRQGVAFQDKIPIDLSTYNGVRAEFIKSTGRKEVPPVAEPVMRKTAKRVRVGNETWKEKMGKLGQAVDQEAARRVLPDHEQNRETIARRMRGEYPCAT